MNPSLIFFEQIKHSQKLSKIVTCVVFLAPFLSELSDLHGSHQTPLKDKTSKTRHSDICQFHLIVQDGQPNIFIRLVLNIFITERVLDIFMRQIRTSSWETNFQILWSLLTAQDDIEQAPQQQQKRFD